MTFDDGVVEVKRRVQSQALGDMPADDYELVGSYYFGLAEQGVSLTRYVQAQNVGHTISMLINIDLDQRIQEGDVAVFEDGTKMGVYLAQHKKDPSGLWYTQLNLERKKDD